MKANFLFACLFVCVAVLCCSTLAWSDTPIVVQTGSSLGTRPIGPVEFALIATGGNGTSYSWSLASGSNLPPGCWLRPDFVAFLPPNTSGDLACVLTTAGNYSFTLNVTSGTQAASQ